jgi:hypothetical protein
MPLHINQCWPHRRDALLAVIKSFPYQINLLEIGCWFGEGSTKIWLENVKPGSSVTLVDSWKPYSSKDDRNEGDETYQLMDNYSTDAFLSTFVNIKKLEQFHLQNNISVSLVRSEASKFLTNIKDNSYELIYVDGDHKYDNAKRDIIQAKRLINKNAPYSIICGDDLELLPNKELIEIAKLHKDRDYVNNFHPGVLLAISEEFSQVNMHNGFWWIVVRNGEFLLT